MQILANSWLAAAEGRLMKMHRKQGEFGLRLARSAVLGLALVMAGCAVVYQDGAIIVQLNDESNLYPNQYLAFYVYPQFAVAPSEPPSGWNEVQISGPPTEALALQPPVNSPGAFDQVFTGGDNYFVFAFIEPTPTGFYETGDPSYQSEVFTVNGDTLVPLEASFFQ
jgi:hypothetical protein